MKYERWQEGFEWKSAVFCDCGKSLLNPWDTTDGKWYCPHCKKSWTDKQMLAELSPHDAERYLRQYKTHTAKFYIKNS